MKPSSFYSISTFSVFFFLLFYWFFFPHFSCVRFLYAVAAFCYLFFSSFHFALVNFTEQFASSIDSIYIFTISTPRWYSVSFIISPGLVYHWYFHWGTPKRCSRSIFTFSTALGRTILPTGVQKRCSIKQKKTDKLKQRCTLKLFISTRFITKWWRNSCKFEYENIFCLNDWHIQISIDIFAHVLECLWNIRLSQGTLARSATLAQVLPHFFPAFNENWTIIWSTYSCSTFYVGKTFIRALLWHQLLYWFGREN